MADAAGTSEKVRVYFDYLCPFAWRGAEVTQQVAQPLGLEFEWRHFSLYQNNYKGETPWQLWNDAVDLEDESGSKGLLPFLASCAARRQGRESFNAFRLATMRARHVEGAALNLATLKNIAKTVKLDLENFEEELNNPECRTVLAKEHHEALNLDVFGTPTFQFENGHLAYFRLAQLPQNQDEAIRLFASYRELLETYPYLETIKRPRPQRN